MSKSFNYKKTLTKKLSTLAILIIFLVLAVGAVVFNKFIINSGAAGTCSAGQRRCNGSNVEVCIGSGNWQSSNCPYGCSNGDCKTKSTSGTCSAGQKRCSGKSLEVCTGSGKWTTSKECEYGCANEKCKPATTAKCTDDAFCQNRIGSNYVCNKRNGECVVKGLYSTPTPLPTLGQNDYDEDFYYMQAISICSRKRIKFLCLNTEYPTLDSTIDECKWYCRSNNDCYCRP